MTTRKLIQDALAVLSGRLGAVAMNALVVLVATRTLDLGSVGLVLFAEAAVAPVVHFADLGLFTVIMRRTVRRESDIPLILKALRMRARALGVCALVAVPLVLHFVSAPAPLLLGFMAVAACKSLRRVGSAVLMGTDRFALDAALTVSLRLVGTVIAVVGLVLGGGMYAWLLGWLVADGVSAAVVIIAALRMTKSRPPAPPQNLIREGWPFWARTALTVTFTRANMILVTTLIGFEAAGVYGIAGKVISTAMLVVQALSRAAFPALARDRRRLVTRRQIGTVLGLAIVIGATIYTLAPYIVWVLTKSSNPELVVLMHIMTPAIALTALRFPLEAWLDAKDLERELVGLAVVQFVASFAFLFAAVPAYGALGAGLGLDFQAALALLLYGGLALSAIRAPLPQPRGVSS